MKSYGGIMDRATTQESLSNAIDTVIRGRKRKQSARAKWILANRQVFIEQCRERMLNGTFHISSYNEYEITERGKKRRIQCIPIDERIQLNALMREVQRTVKRELIHDTASSIEGRGGLWLHKRVVKTLRENRNLKWIYKCDVRKFYESISQEKLIAIVDAKFREENVRRMMYECIRLLDEGISIGLRSSQEFGNIYLSYYLDHRMKDGCGCKHYWRYCDDIVIAAETPEELTMYVREIHKGAEDASLEIKASEQIFCIDHRPLDFLGYVMHGDGKIAIRRHIKQRFARRWKRVKSERRKAELIGSFYGLSKHANARHLFNVITHIYMMNFSDLGFVYSRNGKKDFNVDRVKLSKIVNTEVIVKDFETGIKTREGNDRYVVLIQAADGEEKKFFTNSHNMKQALDFAREKDALPFTAKIEAIGGEGGYIFK